MTAKLTELEQNQAQAEATAEMLAVYGNGDTEEIRQYLEANAGYGPDDMREWEYEEALDRYVAESILSVECDKTYRIVTGTGGPHTEIVVPNRGDPFVRCFGWFGADEFTRPLNHSEREGLAKAGLSFDDLEEKEYENNQR